MLDWCLLVKKLDCERLTSASCWVWWRV